MTQTPALHPKPSLPRGWWWGRVVVVVVVMVLVVVYFWGCPDPGVSRIRRDSQCFWLVRDSGYFCGWKFLSQREESIY